MKILSNLVDKNMYSNRPGHDFRPDRDRDEKM